MRKQSPSAYEKYLRIALQKGEVSIADYELYKNVTQSSKRKTSPDSKGLYSNHIKKT